jgi:putative transposase
LAGSPFSLPTPAVLAEAFRWEAHRTVRKTATVSLHGNVYEVDPALVGRVVELVFDPFDLIRIEVRCHGQSWGLATPHHIGRHAHPKARPETPPEQPTPTGIDYARLIEATHQAQLAQGINYHALAHAGTQVTSTEIPGQLDLLASVDDQHTEATGD